MQKRRCYSIFLVIVIGVIAFVGWQSKTIGIWFSMRANLGKNLPVMCHVTDSQSTQGFGGDGEVYAMISYWGEVSLEEWETEASNVRGMKLIQKYGTDSLDEITIEKINDSLKEIRPNVLESVSYSEWFQMGKYYENNETIRDICYVLNDTKEHKLYVIMNFM